MNENWINQNWFELHPGIQNAIREQLKTFKNHIVTLCFGILKNWY